MRDQRKFILTDVVILGQTVGATLLNGMHGITTMLKTDNSVLCHLLFHLFFSSFNACGAVSFEFLGGFFDLMASSGAIWANPFESQLDSYSVF